MCVYFKNWVTLHYHSLKVDCSIFRELCSYHSNQFGTHPSKKRLHIPQPPSLFSCSQPLASPWIYVLSLQTCLFRTFYIIGINNMWSFGNAFLFSVHIKFSRLNHIHKFRLNDIDTQGHWMFHKDLQALLLLFTFVPPLDSLHHTLMHLGHRQSSVFLSISHNRSYLHVVAHCTSNSHIQNNHTSFSLYAQYSLPFIHFS